MKKYLLLKICLCFFSVISFLDAQGQTIVIFSESFENSGVYQFDTASTSGPSSNTGVNKWSINNKYDGLGVYPDTKSQDSTYLGQISGAPFSHYLHIRDSGFGATQNVFNACYDATAPSDRFSMSDPICTIGMTNVMFSFYYTCMGTANSYGTLYYSANSGPWIQTGIAQYNNKTKWKYEVVTDPAFNNIANLRFGFRWVNDAGSPPSTTSMAIDDINVVATFDSTNIALSVDSVVPDPVCQGAFLRFYWHLAQPFCDGTYRPELSDLTGSFANPTPLIYQTTINSTQTNGQGLAFIPSSTFPGSCYKIRLRRLFPLPLFVSAPSPCFTVQFCPNTITTLGPPVIAMDSNAVCAGSVIDVTFFSTGSYLSFNSYKIQLSDSAGNFVAPDAPGATLIGTMAPPAGAVAYDPSNPNPYYPPPPGSISGLIPDTMRESCLYKIRVIATSPASGPGFVLGTEWGLFCIQHCDVQTNNKQDISFCLYPQDSVCVPFRININFYDSLEVYSPGNQFMVQVISRGPIPPPFTQVGTLGGLGTWTVNHDTTFQWCISNSMLAAAGVPPGSYYMRLVSTGGSGGADSSFSSMIRLTIGKPSSIPNSITSYTYNPIVPEDTFCVGDFVYFFLSNINPASTYYWYSSQILGSPIKQFSLLMDFTGFSGTFTVYVRENNFGCFGPPSPVATIYVRPFPNVSISPPVFACVGDTLHYTVPFASSTVWSWNLSTGLGTLIVDTANNAVNVVFGSAGVDTLFCFGSNACGSKLGFRKITVKDYPVASITTNDPDTSICIGSSITLFNAQTDPTWTYVWSPSSPTIVNDSITVSPIVTTDYIIRVTNPPSCIRRDTIRVIVEQPVTTALTDSFCIGSSLTLDAQTANATSYLWNDSSTIPQLTVSDTGTYSVQVSVTDSVCYDVYNYAVSYVYPSVTNNTDSLCPGSVITLDATTDSATSYLWYDSTNAAMHTVTDTGTYSVQVAVPGEMCYRIYTYSLVYSAADSTEDYLKFCSGDSMLLAPYLIGSAYNYSWNTSDTTENIWVDTDGTYLVSITSSLWRCPRVESFYVAEEPCESEYSLPNVFSPDGSGLNDFFHPCDNTTALEQQVKCPPYKNVRDIALKIFSRWGELVFETTDKDINWNGKKNNNGTNCPDGVYYYTGIVNYIYPFNGRTSNGIHGFITLMRKKN